MALLQGRRLPDVWAWKKSERADAGPDTRTRFIGDETIDAKKLSTKKLSELGEPATHAGEHWDTGGS